MAIFCQRRRISPGFIKCLKISPPPRHFSPHGIQFLFPSRTRLSCLCRNSHLITLSVTMIGVSGVSFLWNTIDASYRGHTSVSTCAGNLESLIRLIIFLLDAATSVANSRSASSCTEHLVCADASIFRPDFRTSTRPSRFWRDERRATRFHKRTSPPPF